MSRGHSSDEGDGDVPARRGFFYNLLTIVVGTVVAAVPFAAAAFSFLDPVMRKREGGDTADAGGGARDGYIRVGTLDALAVGGPPQVAPVVAERHDAWTHYPPAAIGSVYLQRTGEQEVLALHTSCPHAGCFVDFDSAAQRFQCPCHTSAFALDGRKLEGPSPRPLDQLQVDPEALKHGEIRVRFENFLAGVPNKVVVE